LEREDVVTQLSRFLGKGDNKIQLIFNSDEYEHEYWLSSKMYNKLSVIALLVINVVIRLNIENAPETVGVYSFPGQVASAIGFVIAPGLLVMGIGSLSEENRNKAKLLQLFAIGLYISLVVNIFELI